MRILAIAAALALPIALPTAPADAQTLEERIAAVKRQRAEQEAGKRFGSRQRRMLQALLHESLSVDFRDTPVREALEYLRTALGINLVVRTSDDPAGHGIDPATTITLDVDDMPAIDVLELVLEQCSDLEECTWQLRPSYLEVGTKERLAAASAQEMRVYRIDDLLYEAPRFTDAPLIGLEHIYAYPNGFDPYLTPGPVTGSFSGATGPAPGPSRSRYVDPDRFWVDDPNAPERRAERAEAIVDLVVDAIEPTAWRRNGGDWATIDVRDGALIVRAPDFIHRQIGGYPPVPPPKRPPPPTAPAPAPAPASPPVAPVAGP
ncbi:MAG: hypothetical protein ACYTG1_09845 [Planctomycetota bacterium]|jgi:hypothetical protein